MSEMFSWLCNGVTVENEFIDGVGDLITEEFDMYKYYQAERNGVLNKGWLRTMYYFLT